MFTVKIKTETALQILLSFKNISCLRLSLILSLRSDGKINLKTFHVYG